MHAAFPIIVHCSSSDEHLKERLEMLTGRKDKIAETVTMAKKACHEASTLLLVW